MFSLPHKNQADVFIKNKLSTQYADQEFKGLKTGHFSGSEDRKMLNECRAPNKN